MLIIFNVVDLVDHVFSGILTYFGSLVHLIIVLWVIVVEITLSVCLLGQLHSHLIHYLIHSLVPLIYSALLD